MFVSILRWLLNFYEIVNYKEFDIICQLSTNDKVQRTDNTIVSVEFIEDNIQTYVDKFENLSRESSFYRKNEKIYIQSFQYQENGLLNVLNVNFEKKKATLIKRKLFGFEDFTKNMFSDFSNEKLINFHLISPSYLIDYVGNKISNKNFGDLGYKYYKVEEDFDITNDFENVYDREDYQSQIKC